MRVNMNKTKVMISEERQKVMQKAVRWPCVVPVVRSGYTGNVVVLRVTCTVMKSFICRGCMNPVTDTGRTSVDIGGDANLELVDKFCYLGDMLSVDGDADAAVDTRI